MQPLPGEAEKEAMHSEEAPVTQSNPGLHRGQGKERSYAKRQRRNGFSKLCLLLVPIMAPKILLVLVFNSTWERRGRNE